MNFERRGRIGVAWRAVIVETGAATRAIPGEGVASMTAILVRAATAAAGVLALQACTIPHSQYPPSADYQTPAALHPATPKYPVTQAAPAAAEPNAPQARPSPPVEAQPLPPAGPSADIGPRFSNAVYIGGGPLPLWQAAHRHRHVYSRVASRAGHTRAYGLRGRHGARVEEAREAGIPKTYRAKPGDTIYAIGRKFKVSPLEIEAVNGFTQKTHIKAGEIVRLPGAPGEAARTRQTREAREYAPRREAFVPPTEAAEASAGMNMPDHPVPYADLQGGRLVGPSAPVAPPERPIVPPVAQPTAPPAPPTADVLSAGRGRFVWPVRGAVLSGFGPKAGGERSDGLDIGAPDGAPVVAAATGDVVYAGALPQLGNLVLIKHVDGWITAYAHLSRIDVRIKDHVVQGQEVGEAGRSGNAVQSEVYFEIRYAPTPRDKARPVDPALLLAAQ